MPPFLYQLAEYLQQNFRDRLLDVAVILPNRRAGLFLKRHLASMLSGPAWAPAVFSIEAFIEMLADLQEVDQVACLVELYRIHREMEGEKASSFDEFVSWAPQLLADFNEIDRYLVDPVALFTYLDEVRALTVWNPDNVPLTAFQQQYLRFYHALLSYYNGLAGALLSRGEAYQGLIFRHACMKLESGQAFVPWKHILFAGFNALTASEERIIDHLVREGKAGLLWDADSYYLDDPNQEAGEYLRQWFRKWPQWADKWRSDAFRTAPREITVLGLPDLAGQVKLTGSLLRDLQQRQLLDERTAVVLPDENLLLPLLNSLPEGIGEVNITMGLSLSQTPLAGLVELVFHMHHHARKLASGKKGPVRFYFRDVLQVLRHPVTARLAEDRMEGNGFAFRDLVVLLSTGRKTFLEHRELIPEHKGLFDSGLDFLDVLFTSWNSPADAVRGLKEIVETVAGCIRSRKDEAPGANQTTDPPVELEYAYAISKILHQLALILAGSSDFLTWDSLGMFLKQLLERTRLPFYGEPLKGLQIMGMLETRTLDFDRVILLSCNEGILPSGQQAGSFIPFDVRRDFHLPLHHQKDAVYAYHFYRLLQHASSAWLLYDTEPGQLGGGDPSRFLRQIQAELPGYAANLTLRNELVVTPLITGKGYPPMVIPKNNAVMEKLREKAVSGFAPTALNAYRSCSLRFYYAEIIGLKEPEEAAEEIDARTLGSAVHYALKILFAPLLGRPVTRTDLLPLELLAEEAVSRGFHQAFKGDSLSTGKNMLLVEVARIMVRKYIRKEITLVEDLAGKGEALTITMLEKPLSGILTMTVEGTEMAIRIKGFVDRVDRLGGITRVIDYKTGAVDSKEVVVKEWEDLIGEPLLDKGFQLLVYAWLIARKTEGSPLNAGILSLKKQGAGFIAVTVPGEHPEKDTRVLGRREMKKTEEILARLLAGIYHANEPFRQTPDAGRCQFCPYVTLCGR